MTTDKDAGTTEQTIPPAKEDPGARGVDDHVAARRPDGGTQPTEGLDRSVDKEHLNAPSQGVRPEEPAG